MIIKIKTVLISQYPLPYEKIGSWTILYNYYLNSKNHQISYVICPQPSLSPFKGIEYKFAKEPKYFRDRLSYFIKYYKFLDYWKKLYEIIQKENILIVKIIDNPGMLKAIDFYAKKNNVRDKIKIIFFLHGYSYFFNTKDNIKFYEMIDDLVVLTKSSYKYLLKNTHSIPCEVTHIYNGIDLKKFKQLSFEEKNSIKKELGFDKNKIYFLWLSQDRPKKGLHIILRAWKELTKKYSNIELLIIGTHNEIKGDSIKWLGRIPNSKLPKYYQISEFYLFSTLCHEGHPLSLTEALMCGSICIASNIDPISEVMGDGKYGKLVEFPHNPQNWVNTISEEIEKYENNNRVNPYLKNIPENIYDIDDCCENMNRLVEKWKKYLQ